MIEDDKNVTIAALARAIEEFAPLRLQEHYDNSGLLVGRADRVIRKGLICLDVTHEVLDEAEAIEADIVISHHPIIFHPLKRLTGAGYVEDIVERAVKSGIALYACHTNLDSAREGMSYRLAKILGIENISLLHTTSAEDGAGFGVVGTLPSPQEAVLFMSGVAQALGTGAIKHSDICASQVSKVALCTGAGGSQIKDAIKAGADIYLTADLRYNDFIDVRGRITLADIGHFESEYCAIGLLFDIITKKLPTFAVHKSESSRNPINYLVHTYGNTE